MNYAGVELGGTKCVAILARGHDEVLSRETVPTSSPEETLGRIEAVLDKWKRADGFGALGIASFGPIDVDRQSGTYGHMLATSKPGWSHASVEPRLRAVAQVPTVLDTDVNGAAFAEMKWGAGRGMEDFAYVTVGTGVGVGLIVGGRATGGFGHCELGHIRVARVAGDDWPGSCPFHGDCVEGLVSGSALKARFGDELSILNRDHPVWDVVAWSLGQLCHAIVAAAAPRRIVMGGGVMASQPHLIGKVQSKLLESLNGFTSLPAVGDFVRAPELGNDAGPLGSIALAMSAHRQVLVNEAGK
ncbi:MAG: ROK family protein [Sphingomicrobium sp.]